jgi:hypothetical protein
MKRYTIEMKLCTASYIAQPARVSTTEFYSALDAIRLPVPDDGIRPAANLEIHLAEDDLLRLVVACARPIVVRFACHTVGGASDSRGLRNGSSRPERSSPMDLSPTRTRWLRVRSLN